MGRLAIATEYSDWWQLLYGSGVYPWLVSQWLLLPTKKANKTSLVRFRDKAAIASTFQLPFNRGRSVTTAGNRTSKECLSSGGWEGGGIAFYLPHGIVTTLLGHIWHKETEKSPFYSGRRSLADYSPCSRKELSMTKHTCTTSEKGKVFELSAHFSSSPLLLSCPSSHHISLEHYSILLHGIPASSLSSYSCS